MIKQKHFMDIENLREEDTELRQGNGHGFVVGDIIQISEKIDGCLCASTPIMLADGTTVPIRKIVDENLDVEVLTYNFEKETVEPSKIINRFNHGNRKKFIKIWFENPKPRASMDASIICTEDHLFWTDRGYVSAGDLKEDDYVYTIDKRLTEV